MDDAEFEKMIAERKAAEPMPTQLIASAYFRRDGEPAVRTSVFDATVSVGDIYRWAATCEGAYFRFERPYKVVISPAEHV